MACSELRMANAVLKTNFRQLQQQRYLLDADPVALNLMANLLRFPLQASSTQMRNITLTELICGPAVLGIGR
ncbi:MAG: hypothetical protein CM15mP39_08980 [Synechococcus sp.]|nr:MAG: hypothetical protein CM15mP39_08980 [Synechococcus sp.]